MSGYESSWPPHEAFEELAIPEGAITSLCDIEQFWNEVITKSILSDKTVIVRFNDA